MAGIFVVYKDVEGDRRGYIPMLPHPAALLAYSAADGSVVRVLSCLLITV